MVKLGRFVFPSQDLYTIIGIFDEDIRSEPITRNIHMATNIDIWHETFIYLGKRDAYNFRVFAAAIESIFSMDRAMQVDLATFKTAAVATYETGEYIIRNFASRAAKGRKGPRVTLINYDPEDEKRLSEVIRKM